MQRHTIEELARRFPELVSGQKYLNSHTNLRWKCLAPFNHSDYEQTYHNHATGQGCPNCRWIKSGASNRLSIKKLEHIYPELTPDQTYLNNAQKLQWKCLARLGHPSYLQSYQNHRAGNGCPICGWLKTAAARRFDIKNLEKQWPDLARGQTYNNCTENLLWNCHAGIGHPQYKQSVRARIDNRAGCPKCRKLKGCPARRLDIAILEEKCPDLIRGQQYERSAAKLLWRCLAGRGHGPYRQSYNVHTRSGCPKCARSHGEMALESAAATLGIADYEEQKRFPTCRNRHVLPFDGGSEALKTLFEFHGRQHYTSFRHFGGIKKFHLRRYHDRIKRNWARRNGWRLIVVCYRIKNVELYLRRRLK